MAAELLDLNINIGANTTDFEGALQKAENLLKQFEGALKKATNVGEINYLNTQISGLNGTISGIRTQMQSVGKPVNDATNALSNLSRVAQDAPYGFIGIANNLNPLLESFQQLSTKSNGATGALKQMAAGLMGPAGIGLALGVVSSLAVTYGKEIAEFFNGPTEKLKSFREELKKLNEEIYKIVGQASSNRAVGLNYVEVIAGGKTTNQQEEALKKLQSLYSNNKAIKEATIKTDKAYLIHLVNVASKQEEFAGKEKNTIDVLDAAYARRAKLEKEREAALNNVKATTTGSAQYNKNETEKARKRVSDSYKAGFAEIDKDIATAKKKNFELVDALTNIETPDPKSGTKKDSPIVKYTKEELKKMDDYVAKLKARKKEAELVLTTEAFKLFKLPSDTRAEEKKRKGYFEGKAKDLLEESDKTGFGALMQRIYKKDKAENDTDEARKKRLEDLNKKYTEFAQNISTNVTGALFGMFDAMQQGMSFGDALSQMFGRLAQQIAETIVQAAIFAGIFSLISGGAGATGGLSFFGAFTKILGLASGGVATGPTLAMIGEGSESEAVLPLSKLGNMMQGSFNAGSMNTNSMAQNGQFVLRGNDLVLALQRSNSSLNLRRGI